MSLSTNISLVYLAILLAFTTSVAVKQKNFECGPPGEFIPPSWTCDGMKDCASGIDEENCGPPKCESHEWLCHVGTLCIERSLLCNSHDDCPDGSDENSTHCVTYDTYCPMNTMKCGEDGQCVPVKEKCDGVRHCSNGYDENYCDVSDCDLVDQFTCSASECISKFWVCDGKPDCMDRSDEDPAMCALRRHTIGPTPTVIPLLERFCTDGEHHLCGTGECINATFICDGIKHCPDGSDESPQCEIVCQNNGGCGHICHPTPTGPRCSCWPGHILEQETKICKDINECNMVPPLCSQHCINTPGSFLCSCETGFSLEPNGRYCRTTEGRPYILYAEGSEIKQIKNSGHLKHITMKVAEETGHITAFDFDIRTGNIYWTSSRSSYVHVTGPTANTTIIYGVNQCDGLAVDWIGRNIYYINCDLRIINVCGMNATHTRECYTAVHHLADKPKSLALDPSVGRMFWCDDGHSPRIERAYMTGTMREAIVDANLARPTALTLDMTQRRVYWVDSHLNCIESVEYDGKLRIKMVESPLLHAYGLNVFEDFLYWSNTDGIYQSHKLYTNSTGDIKKIVRLVLRPGEVKAMHKLSQPNVSDACSKRNPKCSHFCLLTPMGSECWCPNFMERVLPESHGCSGVDCQKEGVPVIIDMASSEMKCCPVGFGGAKCDNKTGVMFSYPLLAKNNYAWVAGVLCVLVLSIASIIFGIYCCRRKRNEKEIISIIKFRQAAAKTQNAMMDPLHRSKSESTQILVEQSAFENAAYHQEEDTHCLLEEGESQENANNEQGTLVVMSTSDESIDSAFLSRQDSVENDLSVRPLTVSENYDST